jgi:Bacterial extracellular solute-binding proteins, family 3
LIQSLVRRNSCQTIDVLKRLTLFAALVGACGLPARAGTLEDVRSSGVLQCGVDEVLPGFSAQRKNEAWSGLSVDFCRGLALAVIGDAAKVNFNSVVQAEQVEALQSGEIDVLVASLFVSIETESRDGLLFVEPLYFSVDGTKTVPHSPAVRQGDDQWFLTVRWLRHVLVHGDAKTCQDYDRFAGLEKGWACNVLRDVGNYSEIVKRNFGAAPDGANAKVEEGGLLWAPLP